MREQTGVPTAFPSRTVRYPDAMPPQATGTASRLHSEERPSQTDARTRQGPTHPQPAHEDADDDALYPTRVPTSTRRYRATPVTTPPRTVMRITTHKGPIQRASRTQAPERAQVRVQRYALPQLHPLLWVGIVMVCMLLGWMALSALSQWWQFQQDSWRYGMPRTFQMDATVRHGGVSHFTVENLNGHILVYEVVLSDVAQPHLYLGPVFSGPGADMQPATLSFQDVNGDGYPDMIIAVGTGRYLLLNDHHAFRSATSSDQISGKGI